MTVASADRRAVVCFDADALIYAAMPRHPLAPQVRGLFDAQDRFRLTGSMLLLPEVLTRPGDEREAAELEALVEQLDLWPITETVGRLAVWMGGTYKLDPMDATHLAAAVDGGADVFLTNNKRDFKAGLIGELDVVYPEELPTPKRRR